MRLAFLYCGRETIFARKHIAILSVSSVERARLKASIFSEVPFLINKKRLFHDHLFLFPADLITIFIDFNNFLYNLCTFFSSAVNLNNFFYGLGICRFSLFRKPISFFRIFCFCTNYCCTGFFCRFSINQINVTMMNCCFSTLIITLGAISSSTYLSRNTLMIP